MSVDRLTDHALNKATAFTPEERDKYGLHGLLPPVYEDGARQIARVLAQIERKRDDLERYIYLVGLEAENEQLFYQLLQTDPARFLPLVYTPTVGRACSEYGHIFRRPRGMYLSRLKEERFDRAFANWPHRDVRVLCVTSGERILGLGDLGANGIGIPIGKLQLYTACAGVHPDWLMPAHIDFGTNNDDLRADPLYLGLREKRPEAKVVDRAVGDMLADMDAAFPGCMIHFEDWAGTDALRLLDLFGDKRPCFNDDIQGTGSMTLAALEGALKVTGAPLCDQRILFLGGGSAATGIARVLTAAMVEDGLGEDDARSRIAMFDLEGLLVTSRSDLNDYQAEYAVDEKPETDFAKAIARLKPTAIIGVSGAGGAFDEKVIGAMAKVNERPIIFALSNPRSNSECTAQQAYEYSGGRALFASGSPFDPVELGENCFEPAQANNMVVFPGLGLAVTATSAKRVTNTMLLAAAHAVANCVDDDDRAAGRLLPPVDDIIHTSFAVARAVAECIFAEGLTDAERPDDLVAFLRAAQYDPSYEAERDV
ncbi:NAD-dependent malic enzyme [Altererythrobacter sp.]|nr:NAD-dependent malic enzyme [Altererythrobacter sp.]